MTAFWHFARQLLRYRLTLIAAMFFALIAGGSLGAGLLGLAPVLRMVLAEDDAKSLPAIAQQYNAGDPAVEVPQFIIDRLPVDPFRGVALLIVGLAVLTVIGAGFNFLHQYLSRTVSTKAVARIREEAFGRVIAMPLVRVYQRGPTQLVSRISRDASELHAGFIALTSKTVSQVAKGAAGLAAALIFHPGLTLISLIIVPGMAVILRKVGKRIRRGTRGALQAQAGLLQIASETLQGLRAVKANTGEEQAATRFAEFNRTVVRQELRVRTAKALSGPLIETLAVLIVGGLALFAAHLILQGTLAVDRFFLALAALAVAGASFRPVAGLINEIQAATAPAERLLDLMREPGEEDAGAALPALPRHQRSLEFENITLTYPGADRPALVDVSLRVAHGERIAIVGPNGSGKTTLLSLVPRLLTPDTGRVLIDGVDIATASIRSVRSQVGVVTQETVIFHGTVAENIVFGAPPDRAARQRCIEASKRAHADEFIDALPDGYDTNLLEQGASLSGGQRQRLAIARAILRDPSILILDEATSQIDAESESHINEALREFCRGRTSLIIAHRLSTVLNADRIVVMDQGRIVGQGTHNQLLAGCDLYARLNRTQLAPA